jgi:hypothetical protein
MPVGIFLRIIKTDPPEKNAPAELPENPAMKSRAPPPLYCKNSSACCQPQNIEAGDHEKLDSRMGFRYEKSILGVSQEVSTHFGIALPLRRCGAPVRAIHEFPLVLKFCAPWPAK